MLEFATMAGTERIDEGQWIDVRSPWSGTLAGRVASASHETTTKLIARTRAARIHLKRHERHDILSRMAERVEADAAHIAALITSESGLCLRDTTHEVHRVRDVLRFAAMESLRDDSEVFPCDVTPEGRNRRIYTTRQPFSLIAAITPFNHPMNQVAHKIAPAIATNNKTILKPSQITPLSAYYLVECALACGLPEDMVNVISGPAESVAEPMVASPLVDMVTFTGSTATGHRIAQVAGYKRLVLELGGSSVLLVLADADPAAAVDIAMAGIFRNSGQRCTAIRRILVHEGLCAEFSRRLAEHVQALRYGDPNDPDTEVGTVISEAAARQIEERVNQTLARGAKLLAGHKREGALNAPTVLGDVRNDDAVVARETFGPVAPILEFRTLEEGIRIANDTEFGLSGAVVSNHWPSIQRVITELDTGTVNVNEAPSYRLEWSPFGGIKSSGLGYKEGVAEAMKSMTWIKTYSLPWDRA